MDHNYREEINSYPNNILRFIFIRYNCVKSLVNFKGKTAKFRRKAQIKKRPKS